MRLVSNLIRARYRDQILFRPAKNGNVTGRVMILRTDVERPVETSDSPDSVK